MTSPTRKEIERLVSDLKNGDWRRFNAFVADVDNATTVIEDVKAERDAALARIVELETALEKIGDVPHNQRRPTGHLSECAWCNGSASIARAALIPKDASR